MLFRVEPGCGGAVLPRLLHNHFTKLRINPSKRVPNANDINVNSTRRISEAAMSGIFPVLRPSSSSTDSRESIFQMLVISAGVFQIKKATNTSQKQFLSHPYKRTKLLRVRVSSAACEAWI